MAKKLVIILSIIGVKQYIVQFIMYVYSRISLSVWMPVVV